MAPLIMIFFSVAAHPTWAAPLVRPATAERAESSGFLGRLLPSFDFFGGAAPTEKPGLSSEELIALVSSPDLLNDRERNNLAWLWHNAQSPTLPEQLSPAVPDWWRYMESRPRRSIPVEKLQLAREMSKLCSYYHTSNGASRAALQILFEGGNRRIGLVPEDFIASEKPSGWGNFTQRNRLRARELAGSAMLVQGTGMDDYLKALLLKHFANHPQPGPQEITIGDFRGLDHPNVLKQITPAYVLPPKREFVRVTQSKSGLRLLFPQDVPTLNSNNLKKYFLPFLEDQVYVMIHSHDLYNHWPRIMRGLRAEPMSDLAYSVLRLYDSSVGETEEDKRALMRVRQKTASDLHGYLEMDEPWDKVISRVASFIHQKLPPGLAARTADWLRMNGRGDIQEFFAKLRRETPKADKRLHWFNSFR